MEKQDRYSQVKQDILNFIQTHNRRPDHRSQNQIENRLGHWNMEFRQKGRRAYDQAFREQQDVMCKQLGAEKKTTTPIEDRLIGCKLFIESTKRIPLSDSTDPYEKSLSSTFHKYWQHDHWDPNVQQLVEDMRNARQAYCPVQVRRNKDEVEGLVLKFISDHKRSPSDNSKDLYEQRLGRIYYYRKSGRTKGSEEFMMKVSELCQKLGIAL